VHFGYRLGGGGVAYLVGCVVVSVAFVWVVGVFPGGGGVACLVGGVGCYGVSDYIW